MISELAALLLAVSPQEPVPTANIVACLDVEKKDARLACFERVARALKADIETGTDDAATFGEDQLQRAGRADGPESPQSFEARVVSMVDDPRFDDNEHLIVTLANGQVWRQTESAPGRVVWKDGDDVSVRISRRRFGGYRLKVLNRGPSMNVERVK